MITLKSVKKIESNMDLKLQNFNEKKPFNLIYDGDNWGIYEFNEEKQKYEGFMGSFENETIIRAIKDSNYFIKVELIEDTTR